MSEKSTEQTAIVPKIYAFCDTRLTTTGIATFNIQYPKLTVRSTNAFHDRFLILDHKAA